MVAEVGGLENPALRAIQQETPIERTEQRYIDVVDSLVAPSATQAQRDLAYDLTAQTEADGPLTDTKLNSEAALAIAENRTIPVDVSEIAPLVPLGTALGPFDSADAAAIEMMDYSNPQSIEANLENGGLVLEDTDGNFYVTTPLGGTLDGFNPGEVTVPEGMESIGAYHGHADYSLSDGTRTTKENDEFNSDHFSEQDKRVAENEYYGPIIWVSTPSGDFRKYDAATNQDTVIKQGTRE